MRHLLLATLLFCSSCFASTEDKINDFAFNFYKKVTLADENVILSPYSLSTLLSKLALGSGGKTREQFLSLFSLNDSQSNIELLNSTYNKIDTSLLQNNNQLELANAIWPDKKFTFKKTYLNYFKNNPFVNFKPVDFVNHSKQARLTINDWAAQRTHQEIKELLKPGMIGSNTVLVLTNAIYFNGKWALPFQATDTDQNGIFTDLTGIKHKVKLMHKTDKFSFAENDKLQMLELDYKNSSLAMAILLPKSGHTLSEIQTALDNKYFTGLVDNLKLQNIKVRIPKFDINSDFESLEETLSSMGLVDAFGKADFSEMTNNSLTISKVIQKAVIKVDEQGTVASAATAFVGLGSAPPEYPVFQADHPFIYIIYDKQSKVVLFIGQFVEP